MRRAAHSQWTAQDWREHREQQRADEVARGFHRRPAGRAFAGSEWSVSLGRFVHVNADVDAAVRDASSRDEHRQRLRQFRAAERQAAHELEAEARAWDSEVEHRRAEQQAVLDSINQKLPRSTFYRSEWDTAGHWDEYMCRAIQEWASSFCPPDGSEEWEDALMDVAIANATTRVSKGGAPAMRSRRIGALHTLRWLVPGLSFCERPGSLDPDPRIPVEDRAEQGYCVCGIAPGHYPFISEAPFCKVHQMRCASFLTPLPTRTYDALPAWQFSDGCA